jgi:hypothetical protein
LILALKDFAEALVVSSPTYQIGHHTDLCQGSGYQSKPRHEGIEVHFCKQGQNLRKSRFGNPKNKLI